MVQTTQCNLHIYLLTKTRGNRSRKVFKGMALKRLEYDNGVGALGVTRNENRNMKGQKKVFEKRAYFRMQGIRASRRFTAIRR